MTRPLAAALFLLTAAAGPAQDGKKPDYYPLQRGNKWEDKVTAAGQVVLATGPLAGASVRPGRSSAQGPVGSARIPPSNPLSGRRTSQTWPFRSIQKTVPWR